MALKIDIKKGRAVAKHLHHAFATTGIHGHTEMPEDIMPNEMSRGSLAHLLFITLTVAIDYQRDADKLWEVSRKTFEDPETNYLYDPKSLHLSPPKKIKRDMQKYGLSQKPDKDVYIWRTVGVTFYKKWRGDPRNFMDGCGWDSLKILKRLKDDVHSYAGREVTDYPFLRGNKIGPLWLRMMRDNVGIKKLKKLDRVPIPVDIHVARATLATGVVHGQYKGNLNDLFEYIREAWFKSVTNLKIRNRPMIALDADEPLWHLSKYGCSLRDKVSDNCPAANDCEAKKYCINGKLSVNKNWVELDVQ